jgi:hypothetical protein
MIPEGGEQQELITKAFTEFATRTIIKDLSTI